ncbi:MULTISPECIES: AfsR/SARP family transcriptional regulator [unclassified Streptomyces]|uniref:AfsR/SARP family transcriptional regulator n=1 Tax=unclassified Streptomyces TaxID=2593676 RepID=UPI00278C7693|nr:MULTISPECIES: AfsR/SARP family transcriptional regulator [unclassified Streptomyces]
MLVNLLGAMEITEDGIPVVLAGEKLRAIIATLALSPGKSVSSNDLIDELWGERPPRNAANSLQSHIARLRRLLAEGSGKPNVREIVETSSSGYVLHIGAEDVDALRFERYVSSTERGGHAPRQVADRLTLALTLWRGPALLDAGHGMICRTAYAGLEETRLIAHERLIDARLALGEYQSIVPEIEQLSMRHPLRERFCEQFMTALYLSGRQAEALDAYQRTRHLLAHDLGLEPSERLQSKFQRILSQSLSVGR